MKTLIMILRSILLPVYVCPYQFLCPLLISLSFGASGSLPCEYLNGSSMSLRLSTVASY